jgi:hypothetical protein
LLELQFGPEASFAEHSFLAKSIYWLRFLQFPSHGSDFSVFPAIWLGNMATPSQSPSVNPRQERWLLGFLGFMAWKNGLPCLF